MIKYSLKEAYNLENNIDSIYKELLENKYNFSILKTSNKYMLFQIIFYILLIEMFVHLVAPSPFC